jgi:membrane protease YdiL (CAAX protease family)
VDTARLTDPAERARAWRKIAVFYGLALLLSGVFNVLVIAAGKLRGAEQLFVTGITWGPALAAFITARLYGDDWRGFGWDWAPWRWQWRGYWIPLAYALPVYLLVWSTGLGGFDLAGFAAKKAPDFGWSADAPWLVLAGYTLLAGTVGLIIFGARCLGEEIGWRGYLVPQLARLTDFRGVALISGLMWAAWHFPVLLFADYNTGAPPVFSLACFTALVMGISVLMAWLRLGSGSLWPAVIAHAVHNRYIQTIFTPLTTDTGHTNLIIDEFGIGLAVTSLVTGALVWRIAARPR